MRTVIKENRQTIHVNSDASFKQNFFNLIRRGTHGLGPGASLPDQANYRYFYDNYRLHGHLATAPFTFIKDNTLFINSIPITTGQARGLQCML